MSAIIGTWVPLLLSVGVSAVIIYFILKAVKR